MLVCGKAASDTAYTKIKGTGKHPKLKEHLTEKILNRFDKIRFLKGKIKTGELRTSMQKIMQNNCSVFRNNNLISEGIKKMNNIEESFENIKVEDTSLIFNTDLAEAIELDNLIIQSKATLHSALNRKESRGAHARDDFKSRDDKNWLAHTLIWIDENKKVTMKKKPVHLNTLTNHVQTIEPKVRVY